MAEQANVKYLSYQGLKTYNANIQQWTLDQLDKAGIYTEEQIRAFALDEIVKYFQTAVDMGHVNDIRSYQSFEWFPGNSLNPDAVPVSDVQYTDMETGTEYQWVIDDEEAKTGHYQAINETASEQEIKDLFKN